MQQSYPLSWPLNIRRTQEYDRRVGPNKMPAGRIRQQLKSELEKMHAENVVISTNVAVRRDGLPYAGQREPEDPGVVLYFDRGNKHIAMACDRWRTVDANLRAIGLNVEALRGIERWGTADMVDQAFAGYAQLPAGAPVAPAAARPWWEVLQVSQHAEQAVVHSVGRSLLAKYHPDNQETGDAEKFMEVKQAMDEAGL